MGMKLKHLIDSLLSPEIEALPYVERYGGLVQTMHLIVDDASETGIKKRYPVACDVTSRDCVNTGLYQDLIPNDSRKSVVYWEEISPLRNKGVTKTNDFYTRKFVGTARLVFWANLAQLGIDNCKDLFFAIPEIEKIVTKKGKILMGDFEGFQFWTQSLGEAPHNIETIFGKYDYPKTVQYYLYPFDYFAIDVQFELHQCLSKGGSFPDLPAILCPNGAFDKCNYILKYIGEGEDSLKLDCVLPTYDFSDETTQNAVSEGQKTDLKDWLCDVVPPSDPPSSMDFDGTTERIIAPFDSSLEFEYNTPFTLSTYVRFNTLLGFQNIFNKFSTAGQDQGIFCLVSPTGYVRFDLQSQGGLAALIVQTTTTPIIINQWFRIDFVYKGIPSFPNSEIYVNGVQQPITPITNNLGNNSINDPTLQWHIGNSVPLANGLNGLLHEFKFYNTDLTGADIIADNTNVLAFNNGSASSYTPIKSGNVVLRNRTGAGAIFGVTDWCFPDEGTGLGTQSVLMEEVDKSIDIPLSL